MAQSIFKPRDDGRIKLPPVDNAMNKRPGRLPRYDDKGIVALQVGSDQSKKEKLLDRARKDMDRAINSESENRKSALDDRMFWSGDQWPKEIIAQRNLDKRPCQTINKLKVFTRQVVNDQRQNRPSINISPVGDRGDPEVAKMFRGLVRFIERESVADIAYDSAFSDAVIGGFGYWRVLTEFEASDSFNQVVVIRRIRNPFTVYLDPDHQDPTGADAKWGFITQFMPTDEFKEKYPDCDLTPYQEGGIGEKFTSWVAKDSIRIAEYFRVEHEERTLVKLSNQHTGWRDELDEVTEARIKRGSLEILDEREVRVPVVKWFKLTALDILKEEEWPGTSIPIIKVIGDEIDIEGKAKYSGLIRDAKDPQRMYNYWSTALTELVALQPKSPYIVEEGQIEGHEDEWKSSNVKNQPYLSYKGTNVAGTMAPPPQRQPMAGVPTGVVQALTTAAQDMQATTGIRFDATMNERMIDESGRAIRELRRTGDLSSFHFVDNLARALRRTGEILVELIPLIYDEPRVLTILREDDKEEQVKVDPTIRTATGEERRPDGKVRKLFNPTFGKYGVTVTIGPSYATKRIEAAENMMAFMKALPQTAALVADLFCAQQDWPGAEQIAARLAKTIPPQFMQPDMKDVPPQVQAIIGGLENSVKTLTQQLQQAMAALQDKGADRAIAVDKIQKDFEAKILGVVANVETKTAAIEQKSHDNAASNDRMLLDHMANLGKEVGDLSKVLGKQADNDQKQAEAGETIPPAAVAHLRPGRHTRFGNGQVWSVDTNGQPVKISA